MYVFAYALRTSRGELFDNRVETSSFLPSWTLRICYLRHRQCCQMGDHRCPGVGRVGFPGECEEFAHSRIVSHVLGLVLAMVPDLHPVLFGRLPTETDNRVSVCLMCILYNCNLPLLDSAPDPACHLL